MAVEQRHRLGEPVVAELALLARRPPEPVARGSGSGSRPSSASNSVAPWPPPNETTCRTRDALGRRDRLGGEPLAGEHQPHVVGEQFGRIGHGQRQRHPARRDDREDGGEMTGDPVGVDGGRPPGAGPPPDQPRGGPQNGRRERLAADGPALAEIDQRRPVGPQRGSAEHRAGDP